MIRYQDNFLSEDELDDLTQIFNHTLNFNMNEVLPHDQIKCDPLDNHQFVHPIVESGGRSKVVSPHFPLFKKLFLNKLNCKRCERMKINVTSRTSTPIEHGYHTDYWDVSDTDVKMSTAIYYFNTCDGYTGIKTKKGSIKKIESVENRICIFPPHWRHTGTTTSNSRFRTVLNIVYEEYHD